MSNPANKRLKFSSRKANTDLDIPAKVATLKVANSVVSLVSYSGGQEIFQFSGTIIESDSTSAIVLTSAYLVRCPTGSYQVAPDIKIVVHSTIAESFDGSIMAYDFHYHLAAIKIFTNYRLPPASIANLNDSIAIDTSQIPTLLDHRPFGLRPHSNSFDIIPGSLVVCVGRYFDEPYDLMAASGVFSKQPGGFDCTELLMTTCNITRCGIGGPLINSLGDVIGICFYEINWTPFLPINIALTWWEQFKKHSEVRRPWLGMELGNLCSARLEFLDVMARKFPTFVQGAYIDRVKPGSPAEAAGFKYRDVITQFGGRPVRSALEVIEESWKKIGEAVEVVVIRESEDVPQHLIMSVGDVTPDNFYGWLVWNNVP